MSNPTYIACPRCGEPYAMSAMQKRLYHGRTLTCQRCAKPFTVTEETPDPVPAPAPALTPSAPAPVEPVAVERPATAPATAVAKPSGGGDMTPLKMTLLIAVVAVVVTVVLYVAIAPSVHRKREANRRITCASNLSQISLALQVYASGNAGRYPDSLDELVANGSLPPELLVCPSAHGHTPAPGQTPAEQAANLPKGQHVSYLYAGKGMTVTPTPQVLVYEVLAHHDDEGVNVLYTDGTVKFLPRPAALVAIPQLDPMGAATVPMTLPSTAPAGPGTSAGAP